MPDLEEIVKPFSAMRNAVVLLSSRTGVWRAWIGFNLSHSLGAILVGAFVLLVGRSDAAFAADGPRP